MVWCINCPPLRERKEDIALSADTSWRRMLWKRENEGQYSARKRKKLLLLSHANWPGNLMELGTGARKK